VEHNKTNLKESIKKDKSHPPFNEMQKKTNNSTSKQNSLKASRVEFSD